MRRKHHAAVLLACMLLLNCSFIPASAVETSNNNITIPRATGQLNHRLSANTITAISLPVSLDKNETITFNCTYTPKSASIDFGYIDSDGVFCYLPCTNGGINKSIRIEEPGLFTLAIRNNESYAVTITGTVRY